MTAKRRKLALCVSLFIAVVMIIVSAITFIGNKAIVKAEETGSVKPIISETGPKWEDKFGRDGYIVFQNRQQVYTDLFAGVNGVEGTRNGNAYYVQKNGENTVPATFVQGTSLTATGGTFIYREGAPISSFVAKANTFYAKEDNGAQNSIYIPGTATYASARVQSSASNRNCGIRFVTTKANEYVTIYVYNYLATEYPSKVYLFEGTKGLEQAMNISTLTAENGYNQVAVSDEITAPSYITFKLSKASTYTLYVVSNTQERQNFIGGLFFDTKVEINFDLNGGVNSPENGLLFKGSKLAPATKEGHVFDGWYTEEGTETKVAIDGTVYAKFVKIDEPTISSIGPNWKGNFGKNGFIVFSRSGAYSDLYEGNDGTTENTNLLKGNTTIATSNALTGTLKGTAPISIVGHTMNHVNMAGKSDVYFTNPLTIPTANGIDGNNNLRFFQESGNDSIVWMTTKVDYGYVTLYIPDGYESRVISDTNPITLSAYYSESFVAINNKYAQTSDLISAGLNEFGNSVTVDSEAGTYVTFMTGKAGTYYFVIHSETAKTGACTGIFFDSEKPVATSSTLSEFLGQNNFNQETVSNVFYADNARFATTIGNKGYILFGDKGVIYTNQFTGAESFSIVGNGLKSAKDTIVTAGGTPITNSIISDFGSTLQFNNATENSYYSLFAPNTTTLMSAKNIYDCNQGMYYFDITRPTYLTFYIYHNNISTDKKVDATLFVGGFMSSTIACRSVNVVGCSNSDPLDKMQGALSSNGWTVLSTTTISSKGVFLTYKITTPGRYGLLLENKVNDNYLRPAISGVFCDSENPFNIEDPEYVSKNSDFKTSWTENYGKDGYFVFGVNSKTATFESSANFITDQFVDANNLTTDYSNKPLTLENGQWNHSQGLLGGMKSGDTVLTLKGNAVFNDIGWTGQWNANCVRDTWGSDGFSFWVDLAKANEYVTLATSNQNAKISVWVGNGTLAGSGKPGSEEEMSNAGFTKVTEVANVPANAYVTFKLSRVRVYYFLIESEGQVHLNGIFFDSKNPTPSRCEGASLTLDGKIGVNFLVSLSTADLEDFDGKFTFTDEDGANKEIDVNLSDALKEDGLFKMSVKIAPKYYDTPVYLNVGGKNLLSFSIKDYCEAAMESAPDLIESLQNFCMAAKLNFIQGDLDENETKVLEALTKDTEDVTVPSEYAIEISGDLPPTGVKFTPMLEGETSLKLVFKSIEGITFKINGEEVTPVERTNGDGWYEISANNIPADKLGEEIEFTLEFEGGTFTVKASVLSFSYATLSDPNITDIQKVLSKTLYMYYMATIDFVAQNA